MSEVTQAAAQATPNAEANTTVDQTKAKDESPSAGTLATGANPAPDKSTEAKQGEKPVETNSAEKPVVPEKYDLKLPDGSLMDSARVEEIASFAKEQGFSNETAQKVLERENQAISGFWEAQQAKHKERVEVEWVQKAQTDKEIGGEKFKESCELARRFVERHGSEDLKKELDAHGFGNHPELIRIFARAERANSNDVAVKPGPQAGKKRSREELFYGESKQQ